MTECPPNKRNKLFQCPHIPAPVLLGRAQPSPVAKCARALSWLTPTLARAHQLSNASALEMRTCATKFLATYQQIKVLKANLARTMLAILVERTSVTIRPLAVMAWVLPPAPAAPTVHRNATATNAAAQLLRHPPPPPPPPPPHREATCHLPPPQLEK